MDRKRSMKVFLMNDQHTFEYIIETDRVSVGRADHNDWCIPHNEVSKDHFIIYIQNEEFFIQDQGSKNGVFIDGARIEPYKKYPITFQQNIVIARILKLAFYRRPGHTQLGITGAIELESKTETIEKLKK